jgi:hypothetical protein
MSDQQHPDDRPQYMGSLERRVEFDHKRLQAVERQLFAHPGPEGQYQRTGHPPKDGESPLVENPRTVLQRLDAVEARLAAIEVRLSAFEAKR